MTTIVADADIVAVIGPLNSSVALAQIPISNEAGLLQCSPANTNQDLTKGGSARSRSARSGKPINYVRVVTTDDVQGPAAAQYIFDDARARRRLHHRRHRDVRQGHRRQLRGRVRRSVGGTVVEHDAAPKTTTDYVSILTAAKAKNPESIYFGGVTATGGARILSRAQQAGLGDIPYIGPDGINDGSGDDQGLVPQPRRRDAAKNSLQHAGRRGDFPGKADFDAGYKAEYGIDATGYAGQGYACAQVVLDAIKRAGETNPADMAALREAVRAAAPTRRTSTRPSSATIKFDANGDTSQKIVSIYAVDTPAPTARATGSSRSRSTTPAVSHADRLIEAGDPSGSPASASSARRAPGHPLSRLAS